jgi:hypothetical protein
MRKEAQIRNKGILPRTVEGGGEKMTTDKEIEKRWEQLMDEEYKKPREFGEDITFGRAAIRLWRECEKKARASSKHRNAVCEICEKEQDTSTDGHANIYCGSCFAKECEAQRANERKQTIRELCEGTFAGELRKKVWGDKTPEEILNDDPIKEAEQRGYKKGQADLIEKIGLSLIKGRRKASLTPLRKASESLETCDECARVQYKKGQADLIEKLRQLQNPYPKDVFVSKKYEAWRRAWDICKEDAIKAASECLGAGRASSTTTGMGEAPLPSPKSPRKRRRESENNTNHSRTSKRACL